MRSIEGHTFTYNKTTRGPVLVRALWWPEVTALAKGWLKGETSVSPFALMAGLGDG